MGILECASSASAWRGYEYFERDKVGIIQKSGDSVFRADVSGSRKTPYFVEIDVSHPRKSKCNCPHADGRRIICKHMVALYFTAFPKEAKRYYDDVIACEEELERQQEEIEQKLIGHVHRMKKAELCEALLEVLFSGPEWQYDRFVNENLDWDEE